MKVVHVVRQYLPSVGGMEEVVRNLAQHQRHTGAYQPRIVTLDRVFREPGRFLPHEEILDGVPVRRLSFSGSPRYPLCPQVLGTLNGADLVHVHGIDFFFDFLALTRFAHGKPLLASTHGGFFHSGFAPRLKQIYFRTVTRLAALAYRKVVATSENDGAVFAPVVPRSRLQVIENGVDTAKFDNAASAELLPRLIYFGRWSINKGLLETLDLLAALIAQQPQTPWHLTLAGRAYDLDVHSLAVQAQIRGVADHVQLVEAPSNGLLRRHIARASYFVCHSRHEGFGIAPIEAMSAGLVPLLSRIPPFQRLVETSGVGLILDAGGATRQAQQISQLHQRRLMEPHGSSAMRDAARRGAVGYAWPDVAMRYQQLYDQTLERA